MVTKGWCENCQLNNRDGALYCSQCGEELQDKPQPPPPLVISVAIVVVSAWLLFVGVWLFVYASGFNILQNIGLVFLSFVVMLVLEAVILMPRATKQPSQ